MFEGTGDGTGLDVREDVPVPPPLFVRGVPDELVDHPLVGPATGQSRDERVAERVPPPEHRPLRHPQPLAEVVVRLVWRDGLAGCLAEQRPARGPDLHPLLQCGRQERCKEDPAGGVPAVVPLLLPDGELRFCRRRLAVRPERLGHGRRPSLPTVDARVDPLLPRLSTYPWRSARVRAGTTRSGARRRTRWPKWSRMSSGTACTAAQATCAVIANCPPENWEHFLRRHLCPPDTPP